MRGKIRWREEVERGEKENVKNSKEYRKTSELRRIGRIPLKVEGNCSKRINEFF